ncbi:MAG: hypothetical protein H6708_31550 [Kofleriaceae bacterium]|nr:hypothetical protein [Myxococcales bacterium]MCB9564943.1 hypothetical protein [Kofleriaceae bacterium]
MLIAVERLLIRLRQPSARADELIALRRRLRDERAATIDADERALAREVHDRKLAVVAELRAVTSCGSCAAGQPWPVGHHAGGACCAGDTASLFDDRELAALAHAGTGPGDLVAPREAPAGCAFRAATGCTLAVRHRPARCVHYVCTTLRRELHRRGQLDAVEARLAALDGAMQRFAAARAARLDRETVAPLVEALTAASAARRR